MINPRPTDVLETIIANIESKVEPKLTDVDVLSAVTTCKHMVRYVINQLAQERTIYLAELPRLADLLGQAGSFFNRKGGQEQAESMIDATLRADPGDLGDIEALASRIKALREALYQSLDLLIRQRDAWKGDAAYTALRDAIRAYMAWQNEADATIVGPSFYGQGPRR
jgi:hypothetical protein